MTQAGGAESWGREEGAVYSGARTGVQSLARDAPGTGVQSTAGCGAEATAGVWE